VPKLTDEERAEWSWLLANLLTPGRSLIAAMLVAFADADAGRLTSEQADEFRALAVATDLQGMSDWFMANHYLLPNGALDVRGRLGLPTNQN
jgi:uncharacterized membrane protein